MENALSFNYPVRYTTMNGELCQQMIYAVAKWHQGDLVLYHTHSIVSAELIINEQ